MNTNEWLELATSNDDARPSLHKPHGCAAADGIRMHIINDEPPCQCGDDKQHESFDRVIDGITEIPFAFAINKKFLMDALQGINPNGNYVLFFVKDAKFPIVLQDPDGFETAIIMPVDDRDTPTPQNLPRVAPVKVSNISRYALASAEVE